MAMSDEGLTVTMLADSIIDTLKANYEGRVQTVELKEMFSEIDDETPPGQERRPVITPALLLEIINTGPAEEDGTDRQPVNLSLALHCTLSFQTPRLDLELVEYSTDVMNVIRHNRWGFPGQVREPTEVVAVPAEFTPRLDGYGSWVVAWEQVAYLRKDMWAGGLEPSAVWLGFAPKIGLAHIDDYEQIA
jgi:hypothetical protein